MENKLVLITGAAKRIGRNIAEALAKDGWNIAIHYNSSQQEAEDTVKYINSFGVKSCILHADLSNRQETSELISKVNSQMGTISCLINNASIFKNDTIDNFTHSTWDANMAVNLYAPTILIQEFVKQLPDAHSGNIINMLDYSVWRYPEKFMSYTASKAALWALTQQLALPLAKRKIRINAIGPGNTLPNASESEERFRKARLASPLGVGADPIEISSAIKFILSAGSMTGQMLALDGGKHLAGPELY